MINRIIIITLQYLASKMPVKQYHKLQSFSIRKLLLKTLIGRNALSHVQLAHPLLAPHTNRLRPIINITSLSSVS